MAIITRWRMPPESWCGKARAAAPARGCRPASSRFDRRARRVRRAVMLEMDLERLADLEADREARVEAGHRLLEDHRHVFADQRAALRFG